MKHLLLPIMFALSAALMPASLFAATEAVSISREIETRWQQVTADIEALDLEKADESISALDGLRRRAGFTAFEDYSLELLRRAHASSAAGEGDLSRFYLRQAQRLSPASPEVAFRALGLKEAGGIVSPLMVLKLFMADIKTDPSLLLRVLAGGVVPLLWALTAALYATFAMVLLSEFGPVIRRFAMLFPANRRGLAAPPILTVILCLPCFLGMHWSILVWSLVLAGLLAERRQLVYLAAVLFLLWSQLLPVSKNLTLWLGDPDVRAMLKTSAGVYVPGDEGALWLLSSRRPGDASVKFTLAQVLLREGRFDKAEEVLASAEEAGGPQAEIAMERGIAAFLQGQTQAAGRYFASAEGAGASSAEFLFNYSKVKLELLDTESSQAMLQRAEKLQPQMLSEYGRRENELGIRNPLSWPRTGLPLSTLLKSAFTNDPQLDRVVKHAMRGIMPASGSGFLALCGLALLILASVRGAGRKAALSQRGFGAFSIAPGVRLTLKFLPGGSYALAGKAGSSFVLLCIFCLAALPFAMDLPGLATLQNTVAWSAYKIGVILLAVVFCLLSLGAERGASDA